MFDESDLENLPEKRHASMQARSEFVSEPRRKTAAKATKETDAEAVSEASERIKIVKETEKNVEALLQQLLKKKEALEARKRELEKQKQDLDQKN